MDMLATQLPALLPRLWRFALRLTRHHHDAQDLVQRTCLRALERQHQWQPQANAMPWLYTILHSIWLNEMRSRQLRAVDSLDGSGDSDDDGHRGLGVREHTLADERALDPAMRLHFSQVVAAVDALPQAQRVVMLLVAVEGLSYREAADVIGVPIGTVMSRLARARVTIGAQFAAPAAKGSSHAA
jgi:RNA polymerase sigma-70 factor (ECF subfamily)